MAMTGQCKSSTVNLDEYVNAANDKFGIEGDHDIGDKIYCDLEPGHAGNHSGLIQGYSPLKNEGQGAEAWLSWGTGPPMIVYAVMRSDFCTELPREIPVAIDGWRGNDRDSVVDDYRCTLLAAHCGRHAFEYQTFICDDAETAEMYGVPVGSSLPWPGWPPVSPAQFYEEDDD